MQVTKDNGIDEIFAEHNNKKHILTSYQLDLSRAVHFDNRAHSLNECFQTLPPDVLSKDVGGAAAGITLMLLERKVLGTAGKAGILIVAAVGFASGFAWGAGSSVISELRNPPSAQWNTIHEIGKQLTE